LEGNIKKVLTEIACGQDSSLSGFVPLASFCEYGAEISDLNKRRRSA
jgi:hypothetical protein